MRTNDLQSDQIPDVPGVYFFLGQQRKILYIGKATSLRNRIRSYFKNDIKEKRSELIEKMVLEAKSVEYTETDSVLEALIVEANLIRTHKPYFNTRSKDDKSYNHLIITKEEFPRVLVVRGKDLTERFTSEEILYHFGPFPSGQLFREALKIVRKIFKFYDTKKAVNKAKTKLEKGQFDFNKQIGLYPDSMSKKEYDKTIRHIKLFFEGKKQKIILELEKEMESLAKEEKFEEASSTKKRIFALKHIQDVSLIKNEAKVYSDEKRLRIEAYDIAHLAGKNMVGVMTVVEGGQADKNEYRKFKVNLYNKANDPGALKEVLERRVKHPEWKFPYLIVVDGNSVQKKAAETVLKNANLVIPVVAVVKDTKHKPTRIIGQKDIILNHKNSILLANAEAHRFAIAFHRQKRSKSLLE